MKKTELIDKLIEQGVNPLGLEDMTMKQLRAIKIPKSEPVIPEDLAKAYPTKPVTIMFEGRMVVVSADVARVLIKKGKAELI